MAGRIAQLSFFFSRRSFFKRRPQKVGGHRPPLQENARMRWTGQIFWLLAFEEVEGFAVERLRETEKPSCFSTPQPINASTDLPPSSRLHRRLASNDWPLGSCIQLQQRNCSRFPRDFLRRSTFLSSQRTKIDK